jgi:hypothetical protein
VDPRITHHLPTFAIGLAVVGIVAASFLAASTGRIDEIHGVRLGMTAAEVQARFDAAPGGRWNAAPGCEGGALEWALSEGASPQHPRWARFEFHEGMLVAVRLRASGDDPSAKGDRLSSSAGAVLAREPLLEGTVAIALLARGCPDQQDEIRQLISGGPLRR